MTVAIMEDDIVISGMSGRFPESDNVDEFKRNLMENEDVTTTDDRRWPLGSFGVPDRSGKLKDLTRFDASFFGIHSKLAEIMDPQLRILLETIFETVVDAGFNPAELRGTKMGVFVGASFFESNETPYTSEELNNSYIKIGVHPSMLANRISFAFDFKGPSYVVDSGCSSAMIALHNAILSIKRGESEMAIVAGSNIILDPRSTSFCQKLQIVNDDGICRAFDECGTGTGHSEAVAAVLIQKSRSARRIYATILNSGMNCNGQAEAGVMERRLVEQVYRDIHLNPLEVDYIEAHGIGKKESDAIEANWIDEFFCQNRPKPLLIGSTKSNMGYSVGASGLASLVKLICAMEAGVIPANLHFKHPNSAIRGFKNGRLQVVNTNYPWNGGLAAINTISYNGVNAHVVLRSNAKEKIPRTGENLPRLICASGRTKDSVEHLLSAVDKTNNDDLIAIIRSIFRKTIPNHSFRGYQILNATDPQTYVAPIGDERRQVWYVLPGVGSQNSLCGLELMKIEPFRKSLLQCADILKTVGFDLLGNLEKSDDTVNDLVGNALSIICIQIALVDTLRALGLRPDGIIGHSQGEVACAYADGAINMTQTVLGSYSISTSLASSKQPGAMAAVGLSTTEAEQYCSGTNVVVACHNAAHSVTISGTTADVRDLVGKLQERGVLAKEIECSNTAFHSPYVGSTSRARTEIAKLISRPKRRTPRWLSTSVPESDWALEGTQLVSGDHLVDNFIRPVLFHEVIQKIPENSLVIEISPNCIFQGILKQTCPKSCSVVGLTSKKALDPQSHFFSSLGKVYSAGIDLNLEIFDPPVDFPVPRGTPSLSPLIKWDHSTIWGVHSFINNDSASSGSAFPVNLADENYEFLEGHRIDGRVLFPATAYLNLVWQAFAKTNQTPIEKTPVIFENVSILRPTTVTKDETVKFMVNISKTTGKFEVTENGSALANGKIMLSRGLDEDGVKNLREPSKSNSEDAYLDLNKSDIYKELRMRGYEYQGQFQGIISSNNQADSGTLTWSENWIAFMDLMLQFCCLGLTTRELHLPTRILKCIVDPETHSTLLKGKKEISVHMHRNIGVLRSGGVEIRGLKTTIAPRRNLMKGSQKLEEYIFIPYEPSQEMSQDDALNVAVQIVLENCRNAIKVLETNYDNNGELISHLANIVSLLPQASADLWVASTVTTLSSDQESLGVSLITADIRNGPADSSQSFDLVCGHRILSMTPNIYPSVKDGGFILSRESSGNSVFFEENYSPQLKVISVLPLEREECLVLMRKPKAWNRPKIIRITSKNYSWIEPVKEAIREKCDSNILLVNDEDPTCGIIGMFNCIKQEPDGDLFRLVFADSQFDLTESQNQLMKDLQVNVRKGNVWGSMRHMSYKKKNVSPVEHAYVNSLVRGDLSSLRWIESPNSIVPLSDNRILCTVHYAPINFKDVMLASGKLPPDSLPGHQSEMECIMGIEFSGVDMTGRRVMGIVEAQALATSVVAIPEFLWEVPPQWSLEQASTIPTIYSTCIYALIMRGNMKTGDSLLVHAGSGGIGLAAITLALHMGVRVYTTVGSKVKKDFLLKRFPKLTEECIGNSRDASFEQWIMERTEGRGVDIVLNSLSEDKLQASIRCLAMHGRFLEIGKLDLSNNATLGMSNFLKNVAFHGILLDSLFDAPDYVKSELFNLVQNHIDSGAIQPLPVTSYDCNKIEQAFRFMASGKHIGKVVIKIKDEEVREKVKVPAIRKTYFDPNKSYIIIGGLGGFGLELCNWMIKRGARQLIITSRSGVISGHQSYMMRRWREKGYKVEALAVDVTNDNEAVKLIDVSNAMSPVGGIFNLAAALHDCIMVNQTEENFRLTCKPKISTTAALDKASRLRCPQLNYFVVFSSISCGRGNKGQASYGFANSSMERICEIRHQDGLPGMAVQWGAIGDVGMAVNKFKEDSIIGGTHFQKLSSCLDTLDMFLQDPRPVVASCVIAESGSKGKNSTKNIISSIENILGVKNMASMRPTITLGELGLDSLMNAEIKQFFQRTCDMVLSQEEVRNLSVIKLLEIDTKN